MFILIFLLLSINCFAAPGPGYYECGIHGRFEYCIDDIPGCVIGCHCYPGYYFDTQSKICEPNTKLTQDYRRHMVPTSYSVHGDSGVVAPAPVPLAPAAAPAPPGSAAPNDPSPDDAPPDDAELSDWLYNQFFKTIESQVVNKTDADEPSKRPTRRSGGGAPLEPFMSRRNKNGKKKKSKRHGSRKKIIRLDEEKDGESSSSSESESDDDGDLGSWERFEWGRPQGSVGSIGGSEGGGKDAAAHRQIVMYSKRPKPPLPSFIFLPNMQTAFYPPIGLPAPLPMYPMVPVPPINPGQAVCSGEEAAAPAAAAPGAETHAPTEPAPSPAPTTAPPAPHTPPEPHNNTEVPKALRNRNPNKYHPKPIRKKPPPRPVYKPPAMKPPAMKPPAMKPPAMKPPAMKPPPPPPPPPPPRPRGGDDDFPVDFSMKSYDDMDYDAMFMGENNLLFGQDPVDQLNEGPDFKYISQLIHKPNMTNTTPVTTTTRRNPAKYQQYFGMKHPVPRTTKRRHPITPGRLDDSNTRRRFDPRDDEKEDLYYSSLGKQIAKLIRGLDSKGVHDADIKIEPAENPVSAHPFFSESSYASRSYWERFVRSPLGLRLKNFTQYDDLIASNELLFELENQVQEATSAPILSLHELENVVNKMKTMRNYIRESKLKNGDSQLSNSSFNVSLLPRLNERGTDLMQTTKKTIDDHPLNTLIRRGDTQFPRYNGRKSFLNQDISYKTKELGDQSKSSHNDSAIHNLPGSLHLNTHLHKLRSFFSTPKPRVFSSRTKSTRDIGSNFNRNRYNNKNYKPRMIAIAGETTVFKSNKYFFDEGLNWAIQS